MVYILCTDYSVADYGVSIHYVFPFHKIKALNYLSKYAFKHICVHIVK